MSDLRKAAQQALEAIEIDCVQRTYAGGVRIANAAIALRAALAEPETDTDCHAQGICQRSGYSIAPAPRKPLSDEDIDELSRTMVKGDKSVNWLARAIERAHGIGEQHE